MKKIHAIIHQDFKKGSEPMSKNVSKPSVQSIDRAVQILKCFKKGDKLGLTDISRAVGLHKSTTYGLVTSLKNNGFLVKDEESGRYQLGMELYRIASNVQVDLREICMPHIIQICRDIGETTNLVVPDDTNVVYIEKHESERSVRISTSIGMRIPMYCTAVGKAILAFLPLGESSSILDRTQLLSHTQNTLTDKDAIMAQLKEIRRLGYAVDREELEYGVTCVAVPILNSNNRPIAAISCSGPSRRMDDWIIKKVAEKLLRHASEISALI
jgi:IclR family KDG regulon transcriptional repressor